MFYADTLSTVPVPSRFTKAGAFQSSSLVMYADGPIHLQDISKGAEAQRWKLWKQDGVIYLEAYNLPRVALMHDPYNLIVSLGFCFNQNGDLYILFKEQATFYWLWFDATTAKFRLTKLSNLIDSAVCCLDDTRMGQSSRSDVILAYVKQNSRLYFQKQRDRFEIERQLDAGPYLSVEKMYMNQGYRLQWEAVVGTKPPLPALEYRKSYARYVLYPRVQTDYTGYKRGAFDSGYVLPDNQAVDMVSTQLNGLYWTEDTLHLEYTQDATATTYPYITMYVAGLELRLVPTTKSHYSVGLSKAELAVLNTYKVNQLNFLVDFHGATNVTQEF